MVSDVAKVSLDATYVFWKCENFFLQTLLRFYSKVGHLENTYEHHTRVLEINTTGKLSEKY